MTQIQQTVDVSGEGDGVRGPSRCFNLVCRMVARRSGVAAAEYAILAVAIIVVVGLAVVQLSDPTEGAFVRVGTTLASTQSGLPNSIAGR